MKKILVTTDLSENSKEAAHFALKIALHDTYELTFYHVYHLLKPNSWTDHALRSYEQRESKKIKAKLIHFVEAITKAIGHIPHKIQVAVDDAPSVSKSILDYATLHHFNFICLGTTGEGKFRRIIGSIATQLIKDADIPIITVPKNHKTSKLKSVLFASDLLNLGEEVKLSTEFAKSIGAELGLLHIQAPEDLSLDPGLIKQMIKRISDYPLKLHFKNWLLKKTLMENIQLTIEELKPSMLILFTDQDKNLVEKLLFPSFTREYVLLADIPLLIYKK